MTSFPGDKMEIIMIKIKESQTIRTSRNIKGFNSCKHSVGNGFHSIGAASRLAFEEKLLMVRQFRHDRRISEWVKHFDRASGWQRVLPPSART